jgi:hypothetical protein
MLAIPTRGYVWHESAKAASSWEPIYYREKLSVANVRNRIVKDFLEDKYGHSDVLFMMDDDVVPPHQQWPQVMAAAPFDIVAAPVPIAKLPDLPVVLNVFNQTEDGRLLTAEVPDSGHIEVDSVGSGLVMIRREVLEHPEMKQPFQQELDEWGTIVVGQDIQFCRRAKKLGFSIGVACELLCDHFVPLHLNTVPWVYGEPTGEVANRVAA